MKSGTNNPEEEYIEQEEECENESKYNIVQKIINEKFTDEEKSLIGRFEDGIKLSKEEGIRLQQLFEIIKNNVSK